MKNYILIISIALFAVLATTETGYSSKKGLTYPKRMESAVQSIKQLPEVKFLIEETLKEGPITIVVRNGYQFEGLWDQSSRTLSVNPDQHHSYGQLLTTLLFELHNASTSKRIYELGKLAEKGVISKNKYVRLVEKMEHENALQTITLLEKGVQEGIFPKTAVWHIEKDFEKHLKIQKNSGHSDWIARNYDRLRKRVG